MAERSVMDLLEMLRAMHDNDKVDYVAKFLSDVSNTLNSDKSVICNAIISASSYESNYMIQFIELGFVWINELAAVHKSKRYDLRNEYSCDVASYLIKNQFITNCKNEAYYTKITSKLSQEHRTIQQSISGIFFTMIHIVASFNVVADNKHNSEIISICKSIDESLNVAYSNIWYKAPLV